MILAETQAQLVPIPDWAAEDYETPTPFEFLYRYKDNKFLLAQLREKIKKKAGAVGVKNFLTLWKAYLETSAAQNSSFNVGLNATQFDGQRLELISGEYICDDGGVTTTDRYGFEVEVCAHPIMPVKRLINIDTGVVKMELAYKRSKRWRTVIVDKSVVASSQKIVELSNSGIEVNSENARDLVKYLSAIESLNYDEIPETESVGRLGWIAEHGFSPYVDGVTFDGDQSCHKIFDAVKQTGSYDTWLECVRTIRSDNVVARMMIDASFASALINPCNALPFFFHVWGFSGTAKTVCLMVAASVWADPSSGKYIQTFNSTNVGLELRAGICNSLPLCVDELQVIKNKNKFDDIIYMLAEGIGKTRGAKGGGTQHTYTWSNCIITTGEMPISNANSGGGAVNRIVEVDCGDESLVQNPREVVSIIRSNYGWAGRQFAEALQDPDTIEEARSLYAKYSAELDEGGSTEKQIMAAALILTADELVERMIFKDGKRLKAKDIEPFLTSKEDVDQNARAYDWLLDFVASNPARFKANDFGEYSGECWGCEDSGYVYIIKSVFNEKLSDAGYNPASFTSWALRRGKIAGDNSQHATRMKRINGKSIRCVWLAKPGEEAEDDMPF